MTRSGSTASTPAMICSARRSAISTASCSRLGDHLLAQSARSRPAAAASAATARLGLGARGREPRGATLGLAGGPCLRADLLGLGADGGQHVGDAVARPRRRRVELLERVAR